MWDRKEIKAIGKAAFKANYWPNVFVSFILILIAGGSTVAGRINGASTEEQMQQMQQSADHTIQLTQGQTIALLLGVLSVIAIFIAVITLLDVFIFNPIKIGCYAFFRDNVADGKADLNVIKSGFNNYGHNFVTMLLAGLYQLLWSMLLVVPGIIKGYSYRMVPYIVRDNPELTANEVITKSRVMMDGNKWKAFVLDLSFLGWVLLTIVTLGLAGIFWVSPYWDNTNAALYLRLSGADASFDAEVAEAVEVEVAPVQE